VAAAAEGRERMRRRGGATSEAAMWWTTTRRKGGEGGRKVRGGGHVKIRARRRIPDRAGRGGRGAGRGTAGRTARGHLQLVSRAPLLLLLLVLVE